MIWSQLDIWDETQHNRIAEIRITVKELGDSEKSFPVTTNELLGPWVRGVNNSTFEHLVIAPGGVGLWTWDFSWVFYDSLRCRTVVVCACLVVQERQVQWG